MVIASFLTTSLPAQVAAHPSDWDGVDQTALLQPDVELFFRSVDGFGKEMAKRGRASKPASSDELALLDRVLDWSDTDPVRANAIAVTAGYASFGTWKSAAHSIGLAYQHLTVGSEADEMEQQTRAAIVQMQKNDAIAAEQKRDVINALREQLAGIKRPLPGNVTLLSGQVKRIAPLVEVPNR